MAARTDMSSPMPTRRALLASLLAAAASPARANQPIGRIAPAGLVPLLDGLARIDDGDPGRPRVRIVFSPLCHRGHEMFLAMRTRRMDASWAWIPYGAGVDGQRRACQAALDEGTVRGLEAVLRGAGPEVPDRVMAAQDRAVADRAGRMLWEATQTALGTPTLVYRRADGTAMAVRGALDAAGLDRLLAAAA